MFSIVKRTSRKKNKVDDVIQKMMTSSQNFDLSVNKRNIWLIKMALRDKRIKIIPFCFQFLKDIRLVFNIIAGFFILHKDFRLKSVLNVSKILRNWWRHRWWRHHFWEFFLNFSDFLCQYLSPVKIWIKLDN